MGVVEVLVGGKVTVTDGGLGLVLTVVSNAGAQYQVGMVEVPIGSEVVAHVSQHHCVLQKREHCNNRDTTVKSDHVAKEMILKERSDVGSPT